ncbi:DUF4148 domain-containing protein [Herbaspirillum sp. HC18]|nr:DUF4148 domain-containing protein [Herbaspirillum sp. HC18]
MRRKTPCSIPPCRSHLPYLEKKMNAKNLIIAASLFAAAGSVLADDTYPYVDHSKFVGTKTRAEVIAEMNQQTPAEKQARNAEFVEHTNVATGKTRAEVRAELEREYAAGHYASNSNPEFVEHTHVASTRTRDEVRKEAVQAAQGKQTKGTNFGS